MRIICLRVVVKKFGYTSPACYAFALLLTLIINFDKLTVMDEVLQPSSRNSESDFLPVRQAGVAKKSNRNSEFSLPGQRQQYELAFHLLPSFDEGGLEEKKRELEELISQNGGLVSRFGEIKKMKLAYPIKREKFSNFGYIEFFAPKNIIEEINKNLKLNENFLRYLIIKKEEKVRAAKAKKAKPKAEKKIHKIEKPEIKLEEKEIDKKIEEILEKL